MSEARGEREVVARVLAGDVRTGARLMRDLDDDRPAAVAALRALYAHTGRAFIVGITGNPGAGKSTLTDGLIALLRARGLRVGVVAIDPTSPFSGGAILGDRIRMQRHALDPGVFIRSLATRGQVGGLSRSTGAVIDVLDAMGHDVVLVETVGVGQDEVEVIRVADTAIVVTVPGLGDEVQAIKAGLLEVADVLVVNKADRDGADRTVRDLQTMLAIRELGPRDVEIVRTVASHGDGIEALWTAVTRHRAAQEASGAFAERRLRQAEARVASLVLERLRREVDARLARAGGAAAVAAEVAARRQDPYGVADVLADGI